MKDHRHKRLDAAVARRDRALSNVQKLQGRYAAAVERVEAVKAECRERGVAPEKLDAAIKQLEARYDAAISAFEEEITEAEGKLAPFIQEDRP